MQKKMGKSKNTETDSTKNLSTTDGCPEAELGTDLAVLKHSYLTALSSQLPILEKDGAKQYLMSLSSQAQGEALVLIAHLYGLEVQTLRELEARLLGL